MLKKTFIGILLYFLIIGVAYAQHDQGKVMESRFVKRDTGTINKIFTKEHPSDKTIYIFFTLEDPPKKIFYLTAEEALRCIIVELADGKYQISQKAKSNKIKITSNEVRAKGQIELRGKKIPVETIHHKVASIIFIDQ